MTRSIKAAATLALLAAPIALTGCLISGDSRVDVRGVTISSATIESIQAGSTTEDQVIGLLGAPTRTSVTSERTILVYEFYKSTRSDTTVFLVFDGSGERIQRQITYVELKDGVVTRVWADEFNDG